MQPGFTCVQVLAAEPSWLIGSAVSAELWAATAAYANAHGQYEAAAAAFERAADLGGPKGARWRAFGGLALMAAGQRDDARPRLEAAKAAGAAMLADVGLAALAIPADDARAVPVPASMAATDAKVDAEPTVLNFLAEQRLREGNVDGAIGFIRRAVAVSGEQGAEMRLRLAEMLRRRIQERDGFGGPDSAEARRHARAALEEFRRWSGPSEKALGELIDLETLDGDLGHVVSLALPSGAGGSATDREAAFPEIARRGATAALASRNAKALAVFRQALTGDPYLAQLAAQELETRSQDVHARREAWLAALRVADDDRNRASCIMRLADLGVWPIPEADDLLARSIVPDWTYRLSEAVARAAQGDPEGALPVVRAMAQERVIAAVRLIMLLERYHGPTVAAEEWLRQYDRWQDASLVEVMPEALWDSAGNDQARTLISDLLGDQRLPSETRAGLRRRLVHHFGRAESWDRVVRLCRAGLDQQPDDYLAWSLIEALFAQRDAPAARAAMARYRPSPNTEPQARLWAQLHLGVDLTEQNAMLAADLAEQHGDAPTLVEGLTSLLRREQQRREREGLPDWPQDLLDRIAALRGQVYTDGDPDEVAESQVAQRLQQEGYQRLEDVRGQVQEGSSSLAALSSLARSAYGKMLLLRTAGMTLAADPEPGIAAAGVASARDALATGKAVADLSGLYVSGLLGSEGQLLRLRLPGLCVTSSTADDAIRTRDAIWATTAAKFTFGVYGGELRREELSAEHRAILRSRATDLELTTTQLPHRDVGHRLSPALDAIELASQRGMALYADDVALRQIARARGVPAFGTADLIAAAGYPASQLIDLLLRLAAEYVVDLPLDGEQLARLEQDGGWRGGAGQLNLGRSQWWKRTSPAPLDSWRTFAIAAAQVSPDTLLRLTKYALHGALQACTPGMRTLRYQQIVVAALDAVHESGAPAPDDFLSQLAAVTADGVAPQPKWVYHAVLSALRERGVADPVAATQALLPDVARDPQTWT